MFVYQLVVVSEDHYHQDLTIGFLLKSVLLMSLFGLVVILLTILPFGYDNMLNRYHRLYIAL